jgi:hypothetical protein
MESWPTFNVVASIICHNIMKATHCVIWGQCRFRCWHPGVQILQNHFLLHKKIQILKKKIDQASTDMYDTQWA